MFSVLIIMLTWRHSIKSLEQAVAVRYSEFVALLTGHWWSVDCWTY